MKFYYSIIFVFISFISMSQKDTINKKIETVVVTTSVSKMKNDLEKTTFDTKFYANAIGGNGIDVLKNLPSVSIDAQGSVLYRGTSGFALQVNGKTLQIDPVTYLQQIPANSIEKIEIITTPSAKYDSEGKSGIINVITKKSKQDYSLFQANSKIGAPSIEDYDNKNKALRYGGDVVYSFQKKKWDFSIGANYYRNDMTGRREGDVNTIIGTKQTFFPSSGERSFKETNYAGRLNVGYAIDSTQHISLGMFMGKQTKERVADIVYYNNYAINTITNSTLYTTQYYNENLLIRKGDFAIGSVDYVKKFSNNSKFSILGLYEHTLLGGPISNKNLGFPITSIVYQEEYNTNTNPLNGYRFQTDYVFKPFLFGTIEAGYQFKYLDHRGDFYYQRKNNTTGLFELIPEFSSEVNLFRYSNSFYTMVSHKKNNWQYSFGLRLEILDRDFELKDKAGTINKEYEYEYTKLFPSASVHYQFENSNKLKLGYSKRVEHTTTFKMNPFPEREHSETLEQGDAELLPEFIDLVELNYNAKLGKQRVFVTGYFKHIENLINRVNTVYNDTILNRIYSNVGNAKTLGVEFGTDAKWNKFSLFSSANIYHNKINGYFRNEKINTANFQYSLNINANYQIAKTWSTQFNLNYLSERITAQGEDSAFYLPSLMVKKMFFNNTITATLQWQNMDMGLLKSNEQRITTYKPGSFYTTTNYIHEVDMIVLNINYTFNPKSKKTKFVESEFGKQEF